MTVAGEPPQVYGGIGAAFEALFEDADHDPERPLIEFYRREGEVDCLVPVKPLQWDESPQAQLPPAFRLSVVNPWRHPRRKHWPGPSNGSTGAPGARLIGAPIEAVRGHTTPGLGAV